MRIKKHLMACALFSFIVVLVIPGYSIADSTNEIAGTRGVESGLVSEQSSEATQSTTNAPEIEALQDAFQKCKSIPNPTQAQKCIKNLPNPLSNGGETTEQKSKNLPKKGAPAAKIEAVSEAEAVKKEKLPQQKSNTPDFKINYVYRVAGKGKPKSFSNGSELCSGDSIKLIFEPSKNSYVYIFQIDSANKIFRLFPTVDFKGAAKANKNPVQKGVKYFVPAEKKSFKLDQQVGKETIYFVVTQKPDMKLDDQYKMMLAQQNTSDIKERGIVRQQWHSAMTTRGVQPELEDDVTQSSEPVVWKEQEQQFSIMPQYLKNMCEGCVYNVTFQHRDCQR